MTVANRSIKAKPQALPDYLTEDLNNAFVIRPSGVAENSMVHLAPTEELSLDSLPAGDVSVPLEFWLQHKAALLERGTVVAVQVAGAEHIESLQADLEKIAVIVLPFVNFVDGRNYSDAFKLRTRHHYQGEIRAVGDVHFDQIGFLARVGVDAFELSDAEDHVYAQRAFKEFSQVYQPSSDGAALIFSRRRVKH